MNMIPLILSAAIEVSFWLHHPHFGGFNGMISEGNQLTVATGGGVLFCTVSDDGIAFDSTWTYGQRLGWDRVASLYPDSDGSMWIAYLGGGIEVFHPDGSVTRYGQLEGLPLNLMVNQVYPDTVIYAATTQGLSINSLGFFVTYNESGTGGGLPSSVVNCIAPVDSGLFVGTYSGLVLLQPDLPPAEPSSWRAVDLLAGKAVSAIAERNDSLWVIASDNVYICPPGASWTLLSSYPGARPSSILSGPSGISIGDQDTLYTFSGGTWTSVAGNFGGNLLTALAEIEGVGTVAGMTNAISEERLEGSGLALVSGSTVTRHTPPGGISNDIYSIGVNTLGYCWVGSHRSGVGYYYGNEWHRVQGFMPNNNQIFALGVRDYTVFAASYHSGVTWLDWDGQEVHDGITFTASDGLLNDQVTAISVWDDQIAWFAQEPYWATPDEASGVCRLSWQPGLPETAVISTISSSGSLPGKFVRDVEAVSATSAWAATSAGLAELSVGTGVERVFRTSDGLPSDDVLSLAITRSGDVYAGTSTGLARVRNGALQVIDGVPGPVGSLCADNLGGVWAAVPGTLYRLSSEDELQAFNSYNTPLPEVDIRAMACDWGEGLLWLATSHGVWEVSLGQGLYEGPYSPVLYPNPFRPGAGEVLGMAGLPDEPMDLSIFDLSGALLYRCSTTGRDDFAWDGRGTDGSPVPSGVYVLILEQQGVTDLFKFAVVR